MTDEPNVQYLGFWTNALEREYAFAVREPSSEPLQYTLTIANEAFVAHRARYQDAAEICSMRLHRELKAHSNRPPTHRFCVTDAELADYQDKHRVKVVHKLSKVSRQD